MLFDEFCRIGGVTDGTDRVGGVAVIRCKRGGGLPCSPPCLERRPLGQQETAEKASAACMSELVNECVTARVSGYVSEFVSKSE